MRAYSFVFFAALALVSLPGCPGTTGAEDAPMARTDTPMAMTDTPMAMTDTPTTLDAPAVDANTDGGACLAAGMDCVEGALCCAPTTCVPTGGAGLFRCVDETGCIPFGGACGDGAACCSGGACSGGVCLATP